MNPDYMESVIWAFKQLHDKGLVYEGFRVLPYCWNDETPLSNHELRMDDDVYQNRQDPAVTVGFRCSETPASCALVWTTTPWTLPSNLAVMVGADIDYVVVESDVTGTTERYVLGEARLPAYARELADDERRVTGRERLKGADLVGRTLHAAVLLLPRPRERLPRRRGRVRHDHRRHRAGAHRRRLR